ncbi:MAG TPA: hypothetical protein VMM82_05605 [Spirochaetia bacterium]|nr:hypothetical protein [Spirochaetia bacterium]
MQGSRNLTKITRYKTKGTRRSTSDAFRRKTRSALLSLSRSVLLCATPEQVDAAAALAQLISAQGMTNHNYLLFLTLLETNNPFVIDVLVGDRNPFLLFTPIRPNWYLLKETFRILAKYKGNELSEKALLALMGVVQNAYKTSKDGYRIYPLRLSDVYNIGKHLDKDRDQLESRNRLLLDILFDIYYVGIDSEDRNTIRIGIKANDIRMAFFDHTKKMVDALPDVLLVRETARAPVGPKSFSWKTQPVVESRTSGQRSGPSRVQAKHQPKSKR